MPPYSSNIASKNRLQYDLGYESFALNKLIQSCHHRSTQSPLYAVMQNKYTMKQHIKKNYGDWCAPTLFADKDIDTVYNMTKHDDYWIKCGLYSGANARVINNNVTVNRNGRNGIQSYKELVNWIRNKSLNRKEYKIYDYANMDEIFFSEPNINSRIDYKHFIYKGKHIFTQVISDISIKDEYENIVDIDGNDLGFVLVNSRKGNFTKPANWTTQIDRALALGEMFEFMRIDMIGDTHTVIAEMDTLPKKGKYGNKMGTDIIYKRIQNELNTDQ